MKQNQFTGREKLKLSNGISRGAARIFTFVLVLCVFNLPLASISAQEEPLPDETIIIENPTVDPLTAAEQALSWENDTGIAQTASGTSTLGILRMLLTLAVVAAAIYGLVFLFKRLSRGNMTRDTNPFLKVLASVPVGTNRSVHIIAVGPQAWLVGSAEHGVNLISEIQDKETLDAMFLDDARKNAEGASGGRWPSEGRFPNFKALLQRLGMPTAEENPPGPENIRKRGERLKGL